MNLKYGVIILLLIVLFLGLIEKAGKSSIHGDKEEKEE